MKKGVIGLSDGQFDDVDGEQYPIREMEHGEEVLRTFNLGQTITDLNGDQVVEGVAGFQHAEEIRTFTITPDGQVEVDDNRVDTVTDVADLLISLGDYVITESTQKTWAFDLVEAGVDADVEQAEVDLDGLIGSMPEAQYQMAGIYDHPGDADTASASGDGDVFEDDDLGEVLRESEKNRLMMKFTFESETTKILITEGAYVEVYQPSTFSSVQFKRLIDEVVYPHLSV